MSTKEANASHGADMYYTWKWNMLSQRRKYLAFWSQIVCLASWALTAIYVTHSEPYWRALLIQKADYVSFQGLESQDPATIPMFIATLPGSFTSLHLVMLLWGYMAAPLVNFFIGEFEFTRLLHAKQGQKNAREMWATFSLLMPSTCRESSSCMGVKQGMLVLRK